MKFDAWKLLCGILCLAAGCERSEPISAVSPSTLPAPVSGTGKTGPSSASSLSLNFVERTSGSGVDWTYRNGEETGHFAILESLGGGVACVDYDRDGLDDLIFPGGGELTAAKEILGLPCGLFRNLRDWTFQPVAASAFLDGSRYYNHAAACADFNADGFPDLLVTGYGGVQLLQNLGDGTFVETTDAAGLDDKLWSSSAAWGDVNGDGHLDLCIAHYVNWSFENDPFCAGPDQQRDVCPPRMYLGLPISMYLSNGDGGFRSASAETKLATEGKGLGLVLADLDLDGDLDLYVTNDTVANVLFGNDGQGEFQDLSLISGSSLNDRGLPDGSMGVDLIDYNLDGLPDLWVVNYENETAALYRNEGQLIFRHMSQSTGVTAVGSGYVGWGTCCFDADCDGDEDIFVSNGHVIRFPVNAPLRQKPLLFEHDRGMFRNVAAAASGYLVEPHMGRGAAISDLDGDGDLDVVVSHVNEPVSLLSNETQRRGGWIALDLVGTTSPRDAIGAIVRLKTASGTQIRQWKGGGSYASTNTRRLDFGLGNAASVESLEITWPSGRTQTITAPEPGKMHTIVEPL